MRPTSATALPRPRLAAALVAACAAAALPRPADAQRWFETEMVAPPATAAALPTNGYARFYVSSQLGALEDRRRFPADGAFSLLVVNVAISPGGGAPAVTYPVALYDLRERERVQVAALQLGEVQYIDLHAGHQPTVTVKVQAVPRGVAGPFRRAVDQFNQQVQSAPFALVQLPAQVSGLSMLLNSILPPEVEQRWTQTQVVGLTARPDLTVLPLDGRPAVVFLRPAGRNSRVPTSWSELEPCAGNASRVCWASTHQPVTEVPYVLLAVTVTDYRPLADFGLPGFVCTPAAVADYAARLERLVREAPLSQQQRDLEARLLEYVRLVADAAGGRLGSNEGAASAAFRWARRHTGRGDPYWTRNAVQAADRYEQCFTQTLTQLGSGAVNRWNYFSSAFATAAAWERQPPAAGEARREQLEEFLSTILRPVTVYQLGAGEEYAMLREEQRRIEAELLAGDRALAAELAGARTVPAVEAVRARLQARLRTPCESCRELLSAAILQADERIAALQRTALAQTAEEVGRLRDELAAAVGAAEQVSLTAQGVEGMDAPALQVLREHTGAAIRLLGEREPAEEALRQRLALLRAATEAVRGGLQAAAAAPAQPAQAETAPQTPAPEPAAQTPPADAAPQSPPEAPPA